MNKVEPVGEWQRYITVSYTEAIAMMREIVTKKDNLGMEVTDWIKFGDDVIGMLCDTLDINETELCYL